MGLLDDQARNDAEGLEYHRSAFARLSRALTAEDIGWQEPEITDPPRTRTFSAGFPYGYLTQLRRILVLKEFGEPVTSALEVGEHQYELDCEKVRDETTRFDSHLLCHSDSAGYYVPVDFEDPLFLPDEAGVEGGGIVGSSQRLLAELSGIASSIGIDLDEEGVPLAAGETGRAADPVTDGPFETERFAWRGLYRACLASIAGGHAIVFH